MAFVSFSGPQQHIACFGIQNTGTPRRQFKRDTTAIAQQNLPETASFCVNPEHLTAGMQGIVLFIVNMAACLAEQFTHDIRIAQRQGAIPDGGASDLFPRKCNLTRTTIVAEGLRVRVHHLEGGLRPGVLNNGIYANFRES